MASFSLPILALFMAVGSLAGFLAGLMGIGGGIILIPMFLWAFKVAGFPPDILVHAAFGTSLAIILPTALSSTLSHRQRGNVDWHQVLNMGYGGALGVLVGSSLAVGLPGGVLKGLFGIMQMGVGLKLFLHQPYLPPEDPAPIPTRLMLVTGFTAGAFSAFFGVGGGVIAVPMMVIFLRQPVHLAVGNSSAFMVLSSLFGALSYIYHGWGLPQLPPFSLGYVNLLVAVVIAPLTIIFARLGVRLATRTSHGKLLKIFAGFLILTGIYMAFRLFLH